MNVLIIEQDRHLLHSLFSYLTSKKIGVYTAFDGVIAINDFKDDVDVIFIDSNIPRLTQKEVISILKKKKNDLVVVSLLDTPTIDIDSLINNEYIDEYLPRPFTSKDIDFILDNIKMKKGENRTYKEERLYGLIKDESPYEKIINKEMYQKDEIFIYIESLNRKLKDEQIIYVEKGFKLVKKDV